MQQLGGQQALQATACQQGEGANAGGAEAHPQICIQRLQAGRQPPAGAAARLELALLLRHPDVHGQLQAGAKEGSVEKGNQHCRTSSGFAPAPPAECTATHDRTVDATSSCGPQPPPCFQARLARQEAGRASSKRLLTTSGAIRSAATSAGLSARRRSRLNHTMTRRRPPFGSWTSLTGELGPRGAAGPSHSMLVGPGGAGMLAGALHQSWGTRAPRGRRCEGAREQVQGSWRPVATLCVSARGLAAANVYRHNAEELPRARKAKTGRQCSA